MKESFIEIKRIKAALLKKYVNHCATKIQKVFKGYYARMVVVKVKRAFKMREEKIIAAVKGWRIRKIMKTKEIELLVSQINDYERAMKDIVADLSISVKKAEL